MAVFLTDDEKKELKESAGFLYPLVVLYLKITQPKQPEVKVQNPQFVEFIHDNGDVIWYLTGLNKLDKTSKFGDLTQYVNFYIYNKQGNLQYVGKELYNFFKANGIQLKKKEDIYDVSTNNQFVFINLDFLDFENNLKKLFKDKVQLIPLDVEDVFK